jgi:hypothetical protein
MTTVDNTPKQQAAEVKCVIAANRTLTAAIDTDKNAAMIFYCGS